MLTGLRQATHTAGLRFSDRTWALLGMGLAFGLFLLTLQTTINGSTSPYTTDTGEIQNALPRWGTIHWTGYPQYSFIGSLIVTVLRLIGIAPAAGASLVSALWATVAIGLLIGLARDLGVSSPTAVMGGWIVALSTSIWMNASLAEVHTLTVALTLATLWFSLRFSRSGRRSDLMWLAFVFSQGVVHQRAVILMTPAVLVLMTSRLNEMRRHLLPAIGVALLAPLTYLYLPLRVWTGADWVFGDVGSLPRLWSMLVDNRAERIVELPTQLADWGDRFRLVFETLNNDLPWPIVALGLVGLFILIRSRHYRLAAALTLTWIPYVGLSLLIWRGGEIGDALLATRLPILPMVGLGLALVLDRLWRWPAESAWASQIKIAGSALLFIGLVALGITNYPKIIAVTRDPSAEGVIAIAEQVAPPPDDRPTALLSLWGNDFWALAYAQAYQDRLPGLRLVNHNDRFRQLLDSGTRLWALSRTFYWHPVSRWEERLNTPLALSSVAPGVVEVSTLPRTRLDAAAVGPELALANGIRIVEATLGWRDDGQLVLALIWRAERTPDADYSVAVHLVAFDPPRGPDDILKQADQQHPVEGWYPTSRWTAGEFVADQYVIDVPAGTQPVAVRVGLYRQRPDGSFENSPWLSLPLPSR
jgi:hypothetical protein